ncbi:unnamed protein product [Lepeophtheirus salmonis]|uniref:(salmon louse) hypothetical protein n=1 Tax=Lepeophtheirus salmonis TaxID=72036 RepID=A0A7R8D5X4_LEPSM|nr:unnamed protein product [Lepeophtheirus salmonis]CAF3039154.1 unnamed protein product [Lepeophtheirus salmonis]
MNTTAFISTTAHFLDNSSNLVQKCISCKSFFGSHIGVNIGELLNNKAIEFGLINKVLSITADHDPNMSRGVRESELNTTWIGCFAYNLYFIVDNAIENNKVLKYFRIKIAKFATKIKKSSYTKKNSSLKLKKGSVRDLT